MLTISITSRLVVIEHNSFVDDKAVSTQQWLQSVRNTCLFETSRAILLHSALVNLQQHRRENLTEHTVTEVTLKDHCLHLPLLSLLSQLVQCSILVATTEATSVHKVDVTVQCEQHSIACLILTTTTWVNHKDALLIIHSAL
ncbi:hypothetical protein NGBLDFOK_00001 [Dickeya phage W2B]|uniref:Uncharacterized protein n=1 Tax=Dickeya phage W2B TaxID=3049138 RepID=A0AA47LX17_9CAUD|nr:hypothetical protein NGBLDFOK_00001 [Dickeya phage W2B]